MSISLSHNDVISIVELSKTRYQIRFGFGFGLGYFGSRVVISSGRVGSLYHSSSSPVRSGWFSVELVGFFPFRLQVGFESSLVMFRSIIRSGLNRVCSS